MINETIRAFVQILVFTLIPFLVYFLKNKSLKGFFKYIGLKKATKKANILAVFVCLLYATPMLILTVTNTDFKKIMLDPNSITGRFRQIGFGIESIYILIVIALFKTSFAEEILFRGFIAKRLISVLGFWKGNLLQSAIFGITHTALFFLVTSNIFFLLVSFIIPSVGAYMSAFLNEKIANGSIIPGWIAHGLANIVAYSTVGFII